jgi:hypothetical protein
MTERAKQPARRWALLGVLAGLALGPVVVARAVHGPGGERPADQAKGVGCTIAVTDPAANPLGHEYAEVRIRNGTAGTIRVESNLAFGIMAFVDVEVTDEQGVRISKPFYDALISSPSREREVVATLEPGEAVSVPLSVFRPVDTDKIKPGKYKCKARFKYREHQAESQTAEVVLTAEQIKDGKYLR